MQYLDSLRFLCIVVGLVLLTSCNGNLVMNQLRSLTRTQYFKEKFTDHLENFAGFNESTGAFMNCPAATSSRLGHKTFTTSVHKLRPGDIKVIGAMGDSITAGNGANASNPFEVLLSYRGISWSIGGDSQLDHVVTLPNILHKFSRDVNGLSKGVCTAGTWGCITGFNVASAGAVVRDMPGQARLLIQRMQDDKNIDFEKDWKIVTVFIGGNNLCRYCYYKYIYSVERYVSALQEALDVLHAGLPRAFVNVVSTIDVTLLRKFTGVSTLCDMLHFVLCPCGAYSLLGSQSSMDEALSQYRSRVYELVDSGRYDTTDNFTVVIQPFLENMTIPNNEKNQTDFSYLAPDCFHFSAKGHEAAARSLWNNMLQPVGRKHNYWTPNEQLDCPDKEHPYFYTSKNSGIVRPPTTAAPTTTTKASASFNFLWFWPL